MTFIYLMRAFLALFLLGIPAFVAFGIYRDPGSDFSPGVVAFIFVPVLLFIGIEVMIRKGSKISQDEMQMVCDLIERSLLDPHNEEIGGGDSAALRASSEIQAS